MNLQRSLALPNLVAELHLEFKLYIGKHTRNSTSSTYDTVQETEQYHHVIDIFDNKIESGSCVMLDKGYALPWLERHSFTNILTAIFRIDPLFFFFLICLFNLRLELFKAFISVLDESCGLSSVD